MSTAQRGTAWRSTGGGVSHAQGPSTNYLQAAACAAHCSADMTPRCCKMPDAHRGPLQTPLQNPTDKTPRQNPSSPPWGRRCPHQSRTQLSSPALAGSPTAQSAQHGSSPFGRRRLQHSTETCTGQACGRAQGESTPRRQLCVSAGPNPNRPADRDMARRLKVAAD